jgi:D-3-phosphoglycerate dehydrogenase
MYWSTYKPRIAIVNSPHPNWDYEKEELGQFAEIKVVRCGSYFELLSLCKDVDILMVGDIKHIPLTREALKKLPKLKLISVYGVGIDAIDLKAASELGILVANAPEYGVEDVADHTLALMLSLLKRIPMLDSELRKRGWSSIRTNIKYLKEKFGAFRELSSLVVGLIGFGRIGRAVARRLQPFDCKIIAYDPYVPDYIFQQYQVRESNFENLLSSSDIISIHVTLSKETYHLLDEKAFQLMKDGAMLVNTSRGEVVDERALIKALKSGKLSGAALDVFEKEPLPKNHPLTKMPNVILTPHIAWYSEEAMMKQKRETVLNVKEFLLGRKPPYLVKSYLM